MLKRLLSAFLVLAGVAVLFYVWAPARLGALVIVGRSPACPMENALQASENWRRQIAIKDRILAASKKIAVDEQGFEQWDTPYGRYWIPKGSHFVLPFNLAEQERDIYTLGDVRIKPGDVILDCGANVGVYTRKALNEGAATIVAIEPAPENIECLRRNFAPEIASGRVIVYPKGVWDKEDWLTLHVDPQNSAADSFVIKRTGAVDEVKMPLTTIDNLVAELKLPKVDLIKMDIEGAEIRALHGGAQTLARFHPRLTLASYHEPEHPAEIPKAVKAAWNGYQMACGPCEEGGGRIIPDVLLFH